MWLWGHGDDEGLLAKVFGIQRSPQANLWRVGLRHPAADKETRDGVPGTDEGSHLIYDQTTRWSIFDLFESDHSPGEPEPQVIRCCSALVECTTKLLAIIACWSTVWPTLVAAYWPLLKDDPRWGFQAWRFHAAQGVDLTMDAVYCVCTLLRLRTSTLDNLMAFETCSPAALAQRELRSFKFWVDMVTCIPWAVFVPTGPVPAAMACIKVFRVRFLVKPAPSSLILPQDVDLVARSLMLVLVFGHLLSCAYFCLLWYTDTFGRRPYFELTGNMVRHGLGEHYADALRNSVNLVLGADMEGFTDLENFLHVMWTPVGIMANALLFSQILVVISRRFTLENRECVESHKMRSCMQTFCLPAALQLRVFAHYTYERVHKGHDSIHTLAGGLSEQLNFELHLARHFRLILAVPMFRKVQPLLLQEIVSVLQDSVFLPGDFICRFGDEGKEMFFVHRGLCAVLTQDMTVIRHVHEEECIGELSLLTGKQRSASVRAVDFCMVAALSKEHFDRIMKRFPDQLQVIVSGFSEEQKSAILQFGRQLKHDNHMTGTSPSRGGGHHGEPSTPTPPMSRMSHLSHSNSSSFNAPPTVAAPESDPPVKLPTLHSEDSLVSGPHSFTSHLSHVDVDSDAPVTFLKQVSDSFAAAKSALRRSISANVEVHEDGLESSTDNTPWQHSEASSLEHSSGGPQRRVSRLAWTQKSSVVSLGAAKDANAEGRSSVANQSSVAKVASISNRASELLKRTSVTRSMMASASTLGSVAGRRAGAAGLGYFSAGSVSLGQSSVTSVNGHDGSWRRRSAENRKSLSSQKTQSVNDLAPQYFQRVQQADILAHSADGAMRSEQELRGAVDACMEVQHRTGHHLKRMQAAWEGQLTLVRKERLEMQAALKRLVEKMIVAKQHLVQVISEDDTDDLALQAMSVVEREKAFQSAHSHT